MLQLRLAPYHDRYLNCRPTPRSSQGRSDLGQQWIAMLQIRLDQLAGNILADFQGLRYTATLRNQTL